MFYKLGSITAVMDSKSGTITQAQDYDAWGDICRTYSTTDTTINKFTGKERDQETGYDYFGARYYDSRVSVWLSPDPLFEKHIGWSPYNYVLRNPYVFIDPDGRQIRFNYNENEREKEFNVYKHLLPEKFRDYMNIEKTERGEYILNHELLSLAPILPQYDYYIIYLMLIDLSGGPDYTDAMIVKSDYGIALNEVSTGECFNTTIELMEENLNAGIIKKEVYGVTFFPNNGVNEEIPRYSTLADNVYEIYLKDNNVSDLQKTITLGHELVHVYRYKHNLNWKHSVKNKEMESIIKKIEKVIEKNY